MAKKSIGDYQGDDGKNTMTRCAGYGMTSKLPFYETTAQLVIQCQH
jgi:hypothetical protein